jgi:hypothetical protein
MGKVQWFGTVEVNGLIFKKGDNGVQVFYSYSDCRAEWLAYRHKCQSGGYWAAQWRQRGCWRTLSTVSVETISGGVVVEKGQYTFPPCRKVETADPLAHILVPFSVDPPVEMLHGLADLVHRGYDPLRRAFPPQKHVRQE